MKRFIPLATAALLLSSAPLAIAQVNSETKSDVDVQADIKKTYGAGAAAENAAKDLAPGTRQNSGEVDSAAEAAPGQMQKSGEADSAREAAPGQLKAADTDAPSDETTASINLSGEQQTELRTVLIEADAEPVEIDFDLTVGAVVPQTVTLAPLPPRVMEIVPTYEGYEYFVLADGRIVIVEPATLEVVYIVSA